MKKIYFNFNQYSRYFLSGLFLSMMLLWSANSYAQYSGGSGTSGDPYQIATKADLKYLSEHSGEWSNHFKQTADITFDDADFESGGDFYNSGAGFIPIGNNSTKFTGTYNGDGHTISNLYINRSSSAYIGFFGRTNGATIENLGLINLDVTGGYDVGGLVGYNDDNSSVSNAYSTGSVTGIGFAGGLVGYNTSNAIVSNSYSHGDVTRASGSNTDFGGFCGFNGSSTIEYCYSTGDVNCGSATDKGFVGSDFAPTYTNNFFDSEASNQNTDAVGAATAKTTAEMQTQSTFQPGTDDWDFTNTWAMSSSITFGGYPTLQWTGAYAEAPSQSGGTYQIASLPNLVWLAEDDSRWSDDYEQTADIDAAATSSWDDGQGWTPIGNTTTEFEGSYDGDGHTISNLYINRPSTDKIGLFGYINSGEIIENIGVVDVDITGDDAVGGLVGHNSDYPSIVSNAYSTGSVNGYDHVGGLVGLNAGGTTIENSYSTADVTGSNAYIGGLVGQNNIAFTTVENSYSTGSVTGKLAVGGLVGYNSYGSTVSNSFSTADVTGSYSSNNYVGGLVGYNAKATVSNSYSHGVVTRASGTNTNYGGFCGYNNGNDENATIEYCYSTGDVIYDGATDPTDKGFVGGEDNSTTYTANFFDSEASNQTDPNPSGFTSATAKNNTEMITRGTFTGEDWDFENIWAMSSSYNDGYPNLDEEGTEFTWDGSESSDWNIAGNWNQDLVPAGFDNVTVASTSNDDPVVTDGFGVSCKDLTVNSGASLTIKYDGSLITKGSITNNGTIVKEQKFWEGEFDNQWALIAMPNSNTQAGDYFDGMYLQQWNETTASWEDITDSETPLTPVKGYSLWDPSGNTFAYTGTPNTGDQTQTITFTEYSTDPDAFEGANLVGNPYPSFLDWDQISGYGSKYTWNGTAYKAYTQTGSYGAGSQYVEPMEGFIIITNSDGTFRLDNSMRCHPQIPGKSGEQKSIDNGLVLTASNGSYDDELWLVFKDAAAEGFELERDAWKLLSGTPGISQLWTECPDGKLAVDVRPHTETIQLGFANDQAGIYSISLKDIADITEPVLEDTKTNTFHNLTKGAYEFVWEVTDDEKRFKLHLNAVGIEETPISESDILIYAADGNIYIKISNDVETHGRASITVTDIMGRYILQQEINGHETNSIPVNLQTGVYVVMVHSGQEVKTEKVFIK